MNSEVRKRTWQNNHPSFELYLFNLVQKSKNKLYPNRLNYLTYIPMKTNNIRKFTVPAILAIFLVFLISSCAHKEVVDTCLSGHTYGFWGGLWHGIIAPIDFVIMLFKNDVT